MQDAIVIGGGITGLTAGYLMQERGLDITVIDKSLRPGGPIQTIESHGYLVEKGPNTLLVQDPWIDHFLIELGLSDQIVETNPAAKKRYIVKQKRAIAAPLTPLQAITSPLFTLKGKLRLLTEPFRKRAPEEVARNETVAQFARRRAGKEFLDYAMDPFISGVYAGDPEELVLQDAFPFLSDFEKENGSIIMGALRAKKMSQSENPQFNKRSISFRKGLHTLPKMIARKLGNRLWLGSKAVAINKVDGGWQVTWKRDGENFEGFAQNVFLCLPSAATKELTWPKEITEQISSAPSLPHPTVHSLALGYQRDQIGHPLDGFGVLAPNREKMNILGVLFNSTLFPGRAPENHVLLTVMLGGSRREDLAASDQDALQLMARKDLSGLLDIKGAPNFIYLATWPEAIPQYTALFRPWKQAIQGLESNFKGLRFGGNALDGISIGACIMSGKRLADSIS